MKPYSRFLSQFLIALLITVSSLASPTLGLTAAPQNNAVIVPPGSPIEIAFATCNAFPNFQDAQDAVQMAINDFGLLKGFSIQRNDYLTLCDNPSGASAASNIVANLQHAGVIGPLYSSSTMGAAPIFESTYLVMISHGNTNPDLPAYGPNIFNRTVIKDPGSEDWIAQINQLPSVASFKADFQSLFGRTPDDFAVFAYDATKILLEAIEEVSSIDGSSNLVIDRAKLATKVRLTVNFPGKSGSITFDALGNRINIFNHSVWEDSFNSTTLNPLWSWLNEDPAYWSLTARPGFMRIRTRQAEANRLVRFIPPANFEMRTRMLFTPVENFQIGALYVYLDSQNLLKFGRAYCNLGPPFCVGNGIYFDHIHNDVAVGSNFATAWPAGEEVYLRLVKNGATYTGFASTNGTSWTEIGSHTIAFEPNKIGLVATNQGQPVSEIPADFDYFLVEYPESRVYLPEIKR